MGKKQDKKQVLHKYSLETQNLDELLQATLKKKEKEFKQFLWSNSFHRIITPCGQRAINDYIQKISQKKSQMTKKQKQAEDKEKQKYARRKKIFNTSLKEKYSNLLKGIIQQSVPQYKQQLTQDQQKEMKEIQKFYAKYQVIGMFKHNLTKKIRLKHLDSLIKKRYLKCKKTFSKQTIQAFQKGIEKVKQIHKSETLQIIELVN